MTQIEREIVEMVIQETGAHHTQVKLETRLLHDLGMDGDDAVEFFEAIHERYGTDISALDTQWHLYFGGEAGCLAGISIVPGMLIGGALGLWLGWPVWATAILAGVIGIALIVPIAKLQGPPKQKPVTVAAVAAAVEAGAWPWLEVEA